MSSCPEANEPSRAAPEADGEEYWSRVVDLDSADAKNEANPIDLVSLSAENHTMGYTNAGESSSMDADDLLSAEFREHGDVDPQNEIARPLPETLGGYRVGRQIGRGGMGEVFLAEHRSMGRTV